MKIFKRFNFSVGYKSKISLIIFGSLISVIFLFFTNSMAKDLKKMEYHETRLWTRAITIAANKNSINTPQNIKYLIDEIIGYDSQKSFIITDRNLSVLDYVNVENEIMFNNELLRDELEGMANDNEPIQIEQSNGDVVYIFYRESPQLQLMRKLPLAQFLTLMTLVLLISISYSSSKNNEQNRIWVGMAKETAHQLGTPSSSLLGWLEYLRGENLDKGVVDEIGKDISRLLKVVDRFSKIGSVVPLKSINIVEIVNSTVAYFQHRKPKHVTIQLVNDPNTPIFANINNALIEWVMENLIKNSIDAVSGEGSIKVTVYLVGKKVCIDVIDTGKGIPKSNFKKIFAPGFSTKTRGWGLGLSLCKRIVVDNHGGKMYVVQSEIGKGTTIRTELYIGE